MSLRAWLSAIVASLVLAFPAAESPAPIPRSSDETAAPRIGPEPEWNAAVPGVPGPIVVPRRIDVSALPPFLPGEPAPPQEFERNEPEAPHGLPIPPGATVLREPISQREARLASSALAAAPAPPLDASFEGLADDGTAFPPDTNGGASPSQLVTMLNSQFRVQDRAGTAIKTTSIASFWAMGPTTYLTDPRVLYDANAARWFAVILSGTSTPSGGRTKDLLVAVSDGADASGKWSIYDIVVNGTGETYNADFPTVGYSQDRFVVQVNLYDEGFSNFLATRVYVFPRPALESGSSATPTVITTDAFGSTQVPTVSAEPNVSQVFLLEDWFGGDPAGGVMRLFEITGPPGSEALTPIAFLGARNRWSDFVGDPTNFGPQKGSTVGVETNDANVTSSVVYRNGFVWAAHTVFLPADAPTHTSIQWWQIATDGTIAQHGILDDPSGKTFFAFPSIAVNRDDHVVIGCARFSADDFAGAVYTYRAAADPDGTLRQPLPLKTGEAAYEHNSKSDGRNRWGDYSAAVVDPSDDSGFWTIQEFAHLPPAPAVEAIWDTWWGHVSAEAPISPTASFEVLSVAPTAGVPVLFHDISAGGPISWSWDFGDGTASTQKSPRKSYAAPGSYKVTLTASNRVGSHTTSSTVIVLPVPQRLVPSPVSRRRDHRVVDRPQ